MLRLSKKCNITYDASPDIKKIVIKHINNANLSEGIGNTCAFASHLRKYFSLQNFGSLSKYLYLRYL